jgi:hypothetical protein
MSTTEPNVLTSGPFGDAELVPDVWWGTDGIDALIWADPVPYENPLVPSAGETPTVQAPAGDAS